MLEQLRDEFPDITISKIRFLESQGLIDPERTPSGYRRFYDADIARLRWILHQQKEHFLPLKVIKERLEGLDADGGANRHAGARAARRERPDPDRRTSATPRSRNAEPEPERGRGRRGPRCQAGSASPAGS